MDSATPEPGIQPAPAHDAERGVQKTNPESPYLEAVMGLQPVICIIMIYIGHYQPDNTGNANNSTDNQKYINDFCRSGAFLFGVHKIWLHGT